VATLSAGLIAVVPTLFKLKSCKINRSLLCLKHVSGGLQDPERQAGRGHLGLVADAAERGPGQGYREYNDIFIIKKLSKKALLIQAALPKGTTLDLSNNLLTNLPVSGSSSYTKCSISEIVILTCDLTRGRPASGIAPSTSIYVLSIFRVKSDIGIRTQPMPKCC
jgi:hypothetical protein